jgi:integrase
MNQADKIALITLPHLAKTRSGIEFDPTSNLWKFRDDVLNVRMDFSRVHPNAEPLIAGVKGTLIYWLENYHPSTSHSYFHGIVQCLNYLGKAAKAPIRQITAEDILNIKSSARLEPALRILPEFFRQWHRLSYNDIGSDVISLLDQIKLKCPITGQAVATLDPIKGPFTNIELDAIQSALIDAYADEKISRADYLLFLLFISFGSRPVQIAMLKICDLVSPDTPDGDYVLQIPRAKQRGVMGRDLFKPRPLLHQIGVLLAEHAESVSAQFKDILDDPSQAPLFPGSVTDENETGSTEFAHHMSGMAVGNRIRISSKISVPSERLGTAMPLSARRFRYTFGTRAAEEGLPELVIAEMMDHNYPDTVRVYTALTDKIVDRIDRALAMQMAPLAQAFKGHIIASPDEATIANSTSTIIDLRIDQSGTGIGSCGQHSYCGFGAPIACYTCISFEPWLDGPHEEVLDFLLARRSSLVETTDNRIASINDRTILAVAEVVMRCNELKSKGDGNP